MTLLPTPLSKDIKDVLNKQQFINECTVEYETTISKHFQHLKDPRKSGMIRKYSANPLPRLIQYSYR